MSSYLLVHDPDVLQEALFGGIGPIFADMPVRLGAVVASGALGPADLDHAVHEWTLFPYHARFVDPARASEAAVVMVEGGGWPHSVLRSWSVLPPPARLRFCPDCVEDMLSRHPDPWWMRAHQLPSVLVCWEHGVALRDSPVSREDCRRAYVAMDPALATGSCPPTVDDVGPSVLANLVQLARASDALLDTRCDAHPDDRRIRYLAALKQLGLLNRAGEAKLGAVAEAMDRYWGRTLDLWPGLVDDRRCKQGWLGTLLLSGRDSPPLHHLLLDGMLSGRLRFW